MATRLPRSNSLTVTTKRSSRRNWLAIFRGVPSRSTSASSWLAERFARCRSADEPLVGELRKFLDHAFVGLALERHDQAGNIFHRLPAPFDELRLVAAGRVLDVDLAVLAGEAQGKPFLRLAAIFAVPGLADDLPRDVVGEPLVDRRQMLDRADVGLLAQFAQRAAVRVLARVDPALRHLPGMRHVDVLGAVDASADEDEAVAVDHGEADAGAIGQVFEAGHASSRAGVVSSIHVIAQDDG